MRPVEDLQNILPGRNHLILIMTLPGALPPPLWHPPVAIVLHYLFAIVAKSSHSGNTGASQCAPAPYGGQGWRKGDDHHVKRGFLQEHNILLLVRAVRSALFSFSWLERVKKTSTTGWEHRPTFVVLKDHAEAEDLYRILLMVLINHAEAGER